MATNKKFKLLPEQIINLANGYGGCIATDKITVEGEPLTYMYREEPHNELDSGWRFFAGTEDQAYLDNLAYSEVYDVNTIANYEPAIITYLDYPIGSSLSDKRIAINLTCFQVDKLLISTHSSPPIPAPEGPAGRRS